MKKGTIESRKNLAKPPELRDFLASSDYQKVSNLRGRASTLVSRFRQSILKGGKRS